MSPGETSFDPTRPPSRRLVRLGLVFDGLEPRAAALPPLARMCERAGIDAVWVADSVAGTALQGDIDAWKVAAGLLEIVRTATVGVMVGRPAAARRSRIGRPASRFA